MDGGCQGPATEAPPGRELLGVQPAGPPRREVGPASAAVTARTTREGPAQRLQPDAGGGPTAPLPHELLPPTWPQRRRGERPPPRRTASACPCALPGPEEGGGPAADAVPTPRPAGGGLPVTSQSIVCVTAGPGRAQTWGLALGAQGGCPRAEEGLVQTPRVTLGLRGPRGLCGSLAVGAEVRAGPGTGADRASGAEEQGATLVPVPRLISLAVFPLRLSERPRRPLRKGRAGVGDAWGRARLARPPSAPAAWALGRGPRGRGSRGTASRAAPPATAARYN